MKTRSGIAALALAAMLAVSACGGGEEGAMDDAATTDAGMGTTDTGMGTTGTGMGMDTTGMGTTGTMGADTTRH